MNPRFIVDGMLGALVRWLRICGYEARYIQNAPDEELLEQAAEKGLVLLTRDRLLFRKAQRAGLEAFLVEGKDDAEKLASVSKQFQLSLNAEKSRCPNCGAILKPVVKETLKDRVPPRTLRAYDEFWVCGSCGKAYWKGSHWKNILETIVKASRIAGVPLEASEQAL